MITARRLQAQRDAAAGIVPAPPAPPPPPALVPYAEHQAELRKLAQRYEEQLRGVTVPEGGIVISPDELEDYKTHVEDVQRQVAELTQRAADTEKAFHETWDAAGKAVATIAEKDAQLAELQAKLDASAATIAEKDAQLAELSKSSSDESKPTTEAEQGKPAKSGKPRG